jgi:hypothetical protein
MLTETALSAHGAIAAISPGNQFHLSALIACGNGITFGRGSTFALQQSQLPKEMITGDSIRNSNR